VQYRRYLVEPWHGHRGARRGDDDDPRVGRGRGAHDLVLAPGERQRRPIQAFGFVPHPVADGGDDDVRCSRHLGHPAQRIPLGRLPEQLDRRPDDPLEVLEHEVVLPAGDELELGHLQGRRVVAPDVDHELTVEVQPRAVVGAERQRVPAALGGREPAGPAHGEAVRGQLGRGGGEVPGEVHGGIYAHDLGRPLPLGADEVLAAQPLPAVAGRRRQRGRGDRRQPVGVISPGA
jgi:hypothetical protein